MKASVAFFIILFGAFLCVVVGAVLTQLASPIWQLGGAVLGLMAIIFLLVGLPAYYAALSLCYLTTDDFLLYVSLGLSLNFTLGFLDPFFFRSLINDVYRRSLRKSFFREDKDQKFPGVRDEDEYRPYLILNCCIHGTTDQHYVATPLYHGNEESRYYMNNLSIPLFMAASAAAVSPRVGGVKLSILSTLLLSLLDVNMGIWFSHLGRTYTNLRNALGFYFVTYLPISILYLIIFQNYYSVVTALVVTLTIFGFMLLGSFLMTCFKGIHLVFCCCRDSTLFRFLKNLFDLRSLVPWDSTLITDGGHFDNLGLYPLVLQHHKFIICVDGAEDDKNSDFYHCTTLLRRQGYEFADCETVDITRPAPAFRLVEYGYNGKFVGRIFHLKSTFPTMMPNEVASYFRVFRGVKKRHIDELPFTIDVTANQFFDATQVQAYIDLANFICESELDQALIKFMGAPVRYNIPDNPSDDDSA